VSLEVETSESLAIRSALPRVVRIKPFALQHSATYRCNRSQRTACLWGTCILASLVRIHPSHTANKQQRCKRYNTFERRGLGEGGGGAGAGEKEKKESRRNNIPSDTPATEIISGVRSFRRFLSSGRARRFHSRRNAKIAAIASTSRVDDRRAHLATPWCVLYRTVRFLPHRSRDRLRREHYDIEQRRGNCRFSDTNGRQRGRSSPLVVKSTRELCSLRWRR